MARRIKKIIPSQKRSIPLQILSEIDQLSILLKIIKGNCIIFAFYHSVGERLFIVGKLKEKLYSRCNRNRPVWLTGKR
jgi:hypothetical protein